MWDYKCGALILCWLKYKNTPSQSVFISFFYTWQRLMFLPGRILPAQIIDNFKQVSIALKSSSFAREMNLIFLAIFDLGCCLYHSL